MKFLSVVLSALILSCCATSNAENKKIEEPTAPDKVQTKTVVSNPRHEEFTKSDYRRAVNTAVKNMVNSLALDNPAGGKYTVVVGRVVNTTKKDFNTNEIIRNLKSALVQSKKVYLLGSKSAGPVAQIAVTGRITHRIGYLRRGERHEYYLHLNLTEAMTGTGLWDGVTPIIHKSTPRIIRKIAK